MCNECCFFGCVDRKRCYEAVSLNNLGKDCPDHRCNAPDAKTGYRFSKAMTNPGFIGIDDIQNIYLPMGFSNFKIEGRGLGSALILEFLLYYMTKPEYQIHVREAVYLDNMLDLFLVWHSLYATPISTLLSYSCLFNLLCLLCSRSCNWRACSFSAPASSVRFKIFTA